MVACGESEMTANAGKEDSKPSVAPLSDVCLINERRFKPVIVFSS
jgi:hypothetical protein